MFCQKLGAKVVLSRSQKFFFIIILGMIMSFGPICTDIYLPALPILTEVFHSTPSEFQLTLTACFLGLAVGQIIVGPISDALGRRYPLLISLFLFTVSSFLCVITEDINLLLLCRFCQGLSGAGGIVISRSISCDLFKGQELTSFMSVLMAIHSVGPIVGPLLGSFIIELFPWYYIFIFLTLWGFVLLSGSFLKISETLDKDKREEKLWLAIKSTFSEVTNKKFMCYALSASFTSGAFFAYLSASPFVFQTIYNFSPLEFSITFAINAICITVFAQSTGFLVKYINEKRLVYISLAILFISASLLFFVSFIKPSSFVYVAVLFLVIVSTQGVIQTASFTLVMAARKGGAGVASGLFGVLSFAMAAIVSPLVGLLGPNSMIPVGLCIFICSLFALILFFIANRTR